MTEEQQLAMAGQTIQTYNYQHITIYQAFMTDSLYSIFLSVGLRRTHFKTVICTAIGSGFYQVTEVE